MKKHVLSQFRARWALSFGMLIALLALLALTGAGVSTALAQPQSPANTAACNQVIVNSDFESTGGWTEYSKIGASLISNFPPPSGSYHSGTHGAYLADYNNAHDYIAQNITIPADATQATLTFWWQVESQESAVTAYDFLTVTVDSPLGQPVATLTSISNQDAGATWQQRTVDLLAYKGQSVVLRFDAVTDANRPTAFYLDDVTLDVCTPSATPTPTPTATPTHTPTPVPTATPSPTPTATPTPAGSATMAIVPPSSLVALSGQPFTVSVVISDVVDLGGFEFTLSFDPQIVHVSAVSLGDFPGSTGRTISALPVQIDNSAGTVAFGAFSFGTQAGPSGSGVIAQVAMVPQAAGTTPLAFQRAQATNTAGNPLAITTQDGTVTVAECSPYDLDCDGDVDIVDIMLVASHWGCQQGDACYDARYDLDGNGSIDIVDIMQVAAHWGCTNADACYWGGGATPRSPLLQVEMGIPSTRVPGSAHVFALPVQARGAQDLAAVELTIAYDPSVVQVVDVKSAGFLGQNGRQEVMLTPQIDNQAGRAKVGLFTYGSQPGANGDGDVLYLWVKPVGTGQTAVTIERAQAVDTQARVDQTTLQNGQVQVVPGINTFVPFVSR